jgi:hypothetical protein
MEKSIASDAAIFFDPLAERPHPDYSNVPIARGYIENQTLHPTFLCKGGEIDCTPEDLAGPDGAYYF